MNKAAKTVDESRVETVYTVRPNHLNGANRLFGGVLMQWIDDVAGIVAKRHCNCNVTTASVDNLTFLHGAYQNDVVIIQGKLTWVGTSSMEAPLILTMDKHASVAASHTGTNAIRDGIVLGGTALISDQAARTIFAMDADAAIPVK